MKKAVMFILFILSGIYTVVFCQLSTNTSKHLNFGSFCLANNSSGSITVSPNGGRTSSGGIILLNLSPQHMYGEIELLQCDNYNVIITYSSTSTLSNGSSNLILNVGPTNYGGSGASFITQGDCNYVNTLTIGGTLNVPANSLPGDYQGSFYITFNNE